jgi:iron complex transport system substrate-binding protein
MFSVQRSSRAVGLVVVAAWAAMTWSSCGRGERETPDQVVARSTSAAAVEVVDAAGQTVSLGAPACRVVVVGHANFMVLHVLAMFPGWNDVLVGLEKRGKTVGDFLLLLDPAVEELGVLGIDAGPEAIAALQPDLVLTKGTVAGALAQTLGQLEIPVAHVGLEDPDRFIQDVRLIGALLGHDDRAEQIVEYYEQRMARVSTVTSAVPVAERPTVLVAEITRRGGQSAVKVPAPRWMQTLQVELAGGRPVWVDGAGQSDGWTVVTIEQIAAWDPDRIVAVIPHHEQPDEVLAALRADPQWSLLRAVREGALVAFPDDLYGWNNPDPRWLLGLQWMAVTLHPAAHAELDMAAEARGFFTTLYGVEPAVFDERLLPLMELDDR